MAIGSKGRGLIGSKSGFLQATVACALEREDLRDELQEYLQSMLMLRTAAE